MRFTKLDLCPYPWIRELREPTKPSNINPLIPMQTRSTQRAQTSLAEADHYFHHLDLSRCPLLHKKFATSTLISALLKVVTIECIEHDVTCLNERVFIKTVNHLLTNCSQSALLAMVCRLSLLVLNTS